MKESFHRRVEGFCREKTGEEFSDWFREFTSSVATHHSGTTFRDDQLLDEKG